MKPCIICVAITGSLPRKAHNPAVPITIAEQVESTQEAFEAWLNKLELHDPELFLPRLRNVVDVPASCTPLSENLADAPVLA